MINPWLPFLTYWLKMLLISAVLLGYYRLFLRKAAGHTFNRYYLLATVFLALQLPFLRIPLHGTSDLVDHMARGLMRHKVVFQAEPHGSVSQAFSDYQQSVIRQARYIYMVYGLITLLFLWPLLRSLFVIRSLKRRYMPEGIADICVYPTREAASPFSFFNHLFWSEIIATDTPKGRLIFRHELYHIRQLHTLDILAVETIRRVFWCNPFFYLLLRDLKEVHGYLADRHALESAPAQNDATQRSAYAEWLVWQSQGITDIPHLVHSFYHTDLKRRVTLILDPVPARAGYATRWLTLPLFLVIVFAFATRGVYSRYESYKIPAEYRPTLQNHRLTRYLLQRLRYPQDALKKGMEGSVWLLVTVDASGHKTGGGAGTEELDTYSGTATTLTVTSPPLYPGQKIFKPANDTSKIIFAYEAMRASGLTFFDTLSCPPGNYFFSVVFKIQR